MRTAPKSHHFRVCTAIRMGVSSCASTPVTKEITGRRPEPILFMPGLTQQHFLFQNIPLDGTTFDGSAAQSEGFSCSILMLLFSFPGVTPHRPAVPPPYLNFCFPRNRAWGVVALNPIKTQCFLNTLISTTYLVTSEGHPQCPQI